MEVHSKDYSKHCNDIVRINPALKEILLNDMNEYKYSQVSGNYPSTYSFNLNTLFIKAQCCGAGTSNTRSFNESGWYSNHPADQQIPVQCCKSQTVLYPYGSKNDSECTNSLSTGSFHTKISLIITNTHSLITNRQVSTTEQELFVNIETTVANFSTSSTSDKVNKKRENSGTGKQSDTEKESSVNITDSLEMANISSEENISHSMALQPIVALANETDGNRENMPEQDQKINDANIETKNVTLDYEKNDEKAAK
ncbi:unnamed protein product [Mytilus coruscus]|uniref:Uncharacterized protein n=1 Tax=Mytilus coruscus TaxID=42192 RepID=A0A6J8BAW6_MYTCO|nr:unnamed protein product [Mytilus coruscus]